MNVPGAIKAITFDAAGTLMRVAAPVGKTYARIAGEMGFVLSPDKLDRAFREVFPAMPAMAFPDLHGRAIADAERAWWRQLVERVVNRAGGVAAFEKYFDALYTHYARGAAWRAYPDTHPALRSARARGLRIAVISNFDSRLPPILQELGIEELTDAVIHSTACGAAKPDRRIFAHALRTLKVTPECALHVGDSLHADFHGATAAGMGALLVRRRKDFAAQDIPTLPDLGKLDAFLERHLRGQAR